MSVKGRVLLVDDDKEFLEELHETLSLCGYEVSSTRDSTAVREQVRHFQPDIIVLDLKMDQVNGFEVAEELKSFSRGMGIPLIAMTGFFREEEHVPLLHICGISRCIKKPFNPLDIISAIEDALKARE